LGAVVTPRDHLPNGCAIGRTLGASLISLESCDYVTVRNDAAKDGLWKLRDRRQVIHAKAELSLRDRIRAAQDIAGSGFQNASQPTS
jgi:hypothetical protein